jgi:hypothetical protein
MLDGSLHNTIMLLLTTAAMAFSMGFVFGQMLGRQEDLLLRQRGVLLESQIELLLSTREALNIAQKGRG